MKLPLRHAIAPLVLTLLSFGNPSIAQGVEDYGSFTPLPQTGRVTIRQPLKALDRQRLFAPCFSGTTLYAFAESTNYLVQICARNGVPRVYISKDKRNGRLLTVQDQDASRTRQLIFARGQYLYILYRDGRAPERMNAYLQVFRGQQQVLGEALLYIYER